MESVEKTRSLHLRRAGGNLGYFNTYMLVFRQAWVFGIFREGVLLPALRPSDKRQTDPDPYGFP